MKRVRRNRIAILLIIQTGILFAEMPSWWIERGVVDTNAVPNDYAPVNQGQAKQIACQAYMEFNQKLGGVSAAISNLVAGFSTTNNYLPVNLGQLKAIAAPFYDRLNAPVLTNAWPAGMTNGPYPWSGLTNVANDYAIANIGQLKYLFSFDFVILLDSDCDGMPDGWEVAGALNPFVDDSTGDPDGDGKTNLAEYIAGTHPQIANVTLPGGAVGSLVFRYDTDGRLKESHLNNFSSELFILSPEHNVTDLNIFSTSN